MLPPATRARICSAFLLGAHIILGLLTHATVDAAAASSSSITNALLSSEDIDSDAYISWLSDYGDSYDKSLFLPSPTGDGVAIHWSIDSSGESIRLAVAARSEGGWVGFGLAEVGGMPGSDVVLFTASDGRLIDAHVGKANGKPIADACQNWHLLRSFSRGGFVIFEAERQLDTGDTQDRPIVDDRSPNVPPHRIIAAWGDEDAVSYHGQKRVHGAIRFQGSSDGQFDTDIFSAAMEIDSEGHLDLTAEDQPLLADETLYISPCFSYSHLKKLGLPQNEAVHVIGFEPIIGKAGANLHHLGLVSYEGKDCSGTLGSEGVSVFIWAPGEGPLELPKGVGAAVGKGSETKSYKLQVHYNPTGMSGLVDSSGVRLHYTTKLRKHELGYMEIGDPLTALHGMPVGEGLSRYTFDCPETCTQSFDVEEVTVIREMLHMHRAGTRMTNTQIRNGEVLREATVEHYDYRNGGIISVMQDSYKVKRGDMFKTTCYYDSDEDTTFGFETENEMCIAFILYYPKQDIDRCGLDTFIKACAGGYDREELSSEEELGRIFGIEPDECEASQSRW